MTITGSASQGSGTGSDAVLQISTSSPSAISPPSAPSPVATSRLVAPSGFVGSIGGTVTILLSTGQQDITIIDRPGTIALSGAPGGNDIVRFAGAASSYTVTRSGSRVIVSDGDTSVAIAVTGSPINLVFADGARSLRANDNTVLIGDQIVVTTPAAISAAADVAGVPAAGTPAARGQLILAEGEPVVVAGAFDVFGTAARAEVFTALSGDIAVRSGFAGGLDTIAFEAPASTFTATRSASQVILEGPGLRISIPVSTAGVMLRFADDTRSLRFDTEAGQVVIGDQVIGNAPVTLSAVGAVSVIDLGELTPSQGFAIDGNEPGDRAGRSVSSAGDLNGDGFDDIVIGVTGANGQAGETYVLFGSATPFPARTAGEDLTGANGFRIIGQNPFGESGFSVSSAGDVNGDGLADLLIGAPSVSSSGTEASYVIFGSTQAFGPSLALADLNGTNGFRINGALPGSEAGFSVANAGDIDGDGIDDLIIGAHRAAAQGRDLAGSSYIVFGSAQGFGANLDLAAPGASRVTRIDGGEANGLSGFSVASAGDVNGDGIDDVIIGGPGGEATYVVFGAAGGLPPVVNLAGLNGTNGFRLAGAAGTRDEGFSVAGIGDVNGDGIDDLAIGAPATTAGGTAAGATFVVFGSATPFAASLDLAALGLTAGFVISGSAAGDQAGFAVAGAGDVNGDGLDDLIIGARLNDGGGINAGEAYVVFGRPQGSAASLNVFDLDGSNGFRIQGAGAGEEAGFAVASAGDVNGDGFDDLIIGAAGTGGVGAERSGAAFVIFGGATGTENTAAVTRTGTAGSDNLIGNGGNDVLTGSGGADVIRGGAGNDRISIADLAFADIAGGRGTDTLALAGSGLTLDLTGSIGRRLDSIEAIDLTGSGNNRLIVSERAIANLTEARSGGDARLIVTGNAGDVVEARGFVANGTQTIGAVSRNAGDSTGTIYNVFVSGNTVLLAQQDVTVITNRVPVFASAAAITIRENQRAAFDADATDADGDTLTYSLSGPDAARFSINPATGFVAFLTAPDFEAPGDANFDNRYQITVTVSDGRESASQAVTVTVADVNEAPIFASGTTFSVAENTTAAFDADAADPEGTALTYSLSGTDAALFTINAATGLVTFRTAPNFEVPSDANGDNRYQITVTASDGSLSTDQAVTVTVTDVNEAPTALALNNQLANRAENSPSGAAVKVADIAITDDALGTETITLTGPDAAAFEVVNGELRLKAGIALNFEAKSSYAVTVNVVDAAIPGSTPLTANYTLTVTDVNEAPTALALNNQLANRAENSPSAAAVKVADIAITDDALGTETITLTGADAAFFEVVGTELRLKAGTALNFEAKSTYNVTVNVVDAAIPGSTPLTANYTLTVTDVNEAPTALALNNQLADRAENSPSGAAIKVADIAITDDALGTETISLSGADAAFFEVVGSELRLRAGTALNFEAKSSYAVTVNVVDAAIPGSTPLTANYTLTVTDVNEAPTAVVLNNQLAGRAENSPSGAAIRVADIAITDDALGTETISLSGADAAFFEVVGSELRLRAGTALNFEAKSSYAVTVNVVDMSLSAPAVTANYTLNVIDVNEAPVAAADAFSMDENTVLSRNVLTNDVDPDGNALTATVTRGPANGTVLLNPTTGAFDYTPTRNFFGTDSFEYTISDGSLSSTATVTITVINVNEPPVGTADTYKTDEDNALTVTVANGVLANDTDIDSDPLTALLVTGPTNGSLTLNTNGSFVYTPALNFNGTDSFTYRPNDGTESGAPVTVTINVTAVNDAPVSVSDAYTLDEDSSITTTLADGVLSNDSDIEGSGLNAVLVSGPARGTLTFNANGTFTYTPIANANGTDSFTYRAFDGSLLGGPITTVTLTVRPVNDAPVGVADSYTIAEDNTLTIAVPGLLGNDIDIDGDRLTVSSSTTGPATNGTLLLDPNGNFVFTPTRDFNGTATFEYSLTDGTVVRGPVQVTITVTPVNDAPVVAVPIIDQAVDEDTAVNFTVPAGTFTDVDSTTLTYSAALESGAALPAGLSFNATTRTFTGTPPLNFNGALNIRVTASDGTLTASDVFTLTVRPVNDAPTVANPIANQAFNEDTAVNFTVPADTFADVDNATLTYSASLAGGGTLPSWLNFNATTRTFSGTPTPLNFNGAIDVQVTASDGALSVSDVFTLTITPVNDAPDAVDDVATTDEDTAVTVPVASGLLANDTDVDAGTTLSITQINGAPVTFGTPIAVTGGGTVTVSANGSYVFNPNGAYEALRPGLNGTASFTYTISDGALVDTATATITIEGRNERPIAVNDTLTMTGNTPITITAASLLANDSDPDGTTIPAITLTAVGGATNGTVTLSGGSITFTPNTGFTGAASFTYTIQDADGATATGTVNVTVNGLVWYVDNSYAEANGTADGSFLRPFTSLAPLNGTANNGATTGDVDGANDTIFVANTGSAYSSGITLEAGQKLFGDGHAFTVNGIAIGNGVTTNPTINYSTSGITLSTDNEIRGLDINGTATSAVGIQDGNGTVGNLVIAGVAVGGSGKAVDIDQGGNLAVTFTELRSLNSTSEGVHLQGVSGTFTANIGSIQGATNQGFLIGAAGGGTVNSGGNANITFGGNLSNNGSGSTAGIEIQDRTGGTVTLSGSVSDSSGPGIVADGNAGTINFNGNVSISSGSSTAIALTNSTAAVSLAGGLNITTTTGNGFIVEGGGGTVTLSGTGNTITTNSGRAVEIDGVTIGTGGVNFQSVNISTGGTTTGIFLRNAGSGGFTISGTGTTAGSGGTLRAPGGSNATLEDGVGIYIENTNNISLSNLNFTGNFGDFGIRGNTVNGFTLRDSTFNAADTDDGGFGDSSVDDEGVIRFTGLTGTALFEGNNISDGHEDVLRIDNSSGTLNLTVRDSSTNQAVIGRNGTTSGNDGIIVNGSGNSNITVLIDGVQFTGSRGDMIQTEASGTATQNVTIRNNTFANLHPDIVTGGGGITIGLSGGTGAGPGVTYNVENNTFTGSEGTVILTQALGPAGQMSGTILNNVIGTPGGGYNSAQATTGTNGFGNGIEVRVEKGSGPSDLTHAVRIEGNTIRDVDGNAAIFLRSNGAADATGTARLEATVVNNTIAELGPNAFSGIFAQLGGSPGGDGLLGLDIRNNQINMTGATSAFAAVVFDDEASPIAQFYLPGYIGTFNEGALATFLTEAPRSNTITVPVSVEIVGFAPVTAGPSVSGANFVLPVPLMVQAGFAPTGSGIEASQAALEALRDAAIQLWIDAGASDAQIAAMRAITLSVGDLYGGFLGQTTADGIVIDRDAAGFGWFIDATPLADEEFSLGANGLTARAGSEAAKGIDLLTALAHELGHVAGLDDVFDDAAGVMDAFLAPGERNLPEAISAEGSGTILMVEVVSGPIWDAISMMPYDARVL